MYIVNTSFMVEHAVHNLWLEMVTKHFLQMIREAGYDRIVFSRVLSNDNGQHFTYSLQITVDDMSGYKDITERLLNEYNETAQPAFGDKVHYFTSIMKIIE